MASPHPALAVLGVGSQADMLLDNALSNTLTPEVLVDFPWQCYVLLKGSEDLTSNKTKQKLRTPKLTSCKPLCFSDNLCFAIRRTF